jgi:hypothetical protein
MRERQGRHSTPDLAHEKQLIVQVGLSPDSEYVVAVWMTEFALEIFVAALLYQGQDHGDHALTARRAAVSDGEEGSHSSNHRCRPHLRPPPRNQTLPPIVGGISAVEQVKEAG